MSTKKNNIRIAIVASNFNRDIVDRLYSGAIPTLEKNGINIIVFENDENKKLTDDVLPNNWISFHGNKYIIHSMYAKSRRGEKNKSFIKNV